MGSRQRCWRYDWIEGGSEGGLKNCATSPCGDATDWEVVSRLLGERKPLLMVTDPPYGIELDSEWRDRAGLNGRGPAERMSRP
jgi:hypothetical protein